MEAKDTVIRTTEENCHNTLEERLLEQAKVSFKVGIDEEYKRWVKACMRAGMLVSEPEQLTNLYKAGMSEMVELIDKAGLIEHTSNPLHEVGATILSCPACCWYALKKERGL